MKGGAAGSRCCHRGPSAAGVDKARGRGSRVKPLVVSFCPPVSEQGLLWLNIPGGQVSRELALQCPLGCGADRGVAGSGSESTQGSLGLSCMQPQSNPPGKQPQLVRELPSSLVLSDT